MDDSRLIVTSNLKKKMKTATSVTFYIHKHGFSYINLIHKKGNIESYTEIPINTSLPPNFSKAIAIILYANKTGNWNVLSQFIKKGDILTFGVEQNNNQLMDNAGLFSDEVIVNIVRNNKLIVNRMVIHHQNNLPNSARILQL